MFISFKKRSVLIILAVIVCLGAIGSVVGINLSKSASSNSYKKVIVIDAGHGGIDGGVVGATGVKESDINLSIAKSLKHFLSKNGYKVVLTRSSTDGLYGMATSGRKLKDMQARKQIILDAQPDLVVSIHQNSYPRASEHGAQVFYAPNSADGLTKATTMQNILNMTLYSTRAQAKGDYYILQCTEYPSLLVECGFLSNPTEEKLLISANYQEKVAYSIYTGINTIFYAEQGSDQT